MYSVVILSSITASAAAAFTTFLTDIFNAVPNIIAALLTLLIGYLIVRVVVGGVKFGMTRANVDRYVAPTEVGQFLARTGQTFTGLIVGMVKWLLIIVVAIYAVSVLAIPALTASMLAILSWIPDLVGAAIIVVVGALIASFAGRVIGDNLPALGVGGGRLVGLAVKLIIYALVFDFALIQLGLGQGILYTMTTAMIWGLAAALAVGIGVPMAFSLRGVMTSMASGATTIQSTLREGQHITVEGIDNAGDHGRVSGTVRSVGMFNTIVEDGDGRRGYLILPNSMLVDRPISVDGGEPPDLFDRRVQRSVSQADRRVNTEPPEGPEEPVPPPRRTVSPTTGA